MTGRRAVSAIRYTYNYVKQSSDFHYRWYVIILICIIDSNQ